MSYHTIYENETGITIDLAFGKYYRSSISRKAIKHCIEYTLLEDPKNTTEVGFSCFI